MQFLDLTLPSPEENLALDEALLLEAEASDDLASGGRQAPGLDQELELLRFWESPRYAVVMGASSRLSEEVNESACLSDGVPILRRCSGGGTVLLGPGCLAFSLILSRERTGFENVTRSYQAILNRMAQALQSCETTVNFAGTSDLAVGDMKFSGNSQRRKDEYLLHHGTILHAFDLSRVERYLHLPKRQPAYRQQRDHEAFLANLPMEAAEIKHQMRAEWQANDVRLQWPEKLVQELVANKYSKLEWIRRR